MVSTITAEIDSLDSVARKILDTLEQNDLNLLCLIGDLGAGKTTLTQRIGQQLGIKNTIQSPTFVLMNQHSSEINSAKFNTINHIDVYRIDEDSETEILDINSLRQEKSALTIIEWADKISHLIKPPYLQCTITIDEVESEKRKFTLEIKN